MRAWVEKNEYPISGYFELRSDCCDAIKAWFGKDTVVDRFAVFGAGPDGSLYVIWRQDDGRVPIAHLDSEGQNNTVLASDFVGFLRLLAIGYNEIGSDDLTNPPADKDQINPAFQEWVRTTFSVPIPALGVEVVEPTRRTHDDFEAWIQCVLRG